MSCSLKIMHCIGLWFTQHGHFLVVSAATIQCESKKQDTLLVSIISQNIKALSNFQNPFTARLSTKFATKSSLHITPHLKDLVKPLCFKNRINSTIRYWRNVVLERKFMRIYLLNFYIWLHFLFDTLPLDVNKKQINLTNK